MYLRMDALRSYLPAIGDSALSKALLAIGALVTANAAYKILSFIGLYTRPSQLARYRHSTDGNPPWALVTGATSGIGKCLAHELAGAGFDVILHGRSETKLAAARAELAAAFPGRAFRSLLADAGRTDPDFAALVAPLADLNITVLINNAGGGPSDPTYSTLDAQPAPSLLATVSLNALFPALLTAALLPRLEAARPALVVNISSLSDNGLPFLASYSGAKSFLMTMSACLGRELAIDGRGVDVLGVRVGSVTGVSHNDAPPSFFEPAAPTMARAILARVGCGRQVVVGYIGHALQQAGVELVPAWRREKIFADVMVKLRDEERRKRKSL